MERANPTRTDLLSRRAQIRLADAGARLLKSKREALVRELLACARDLEEKRRRMLRDHSEALRALMYSMALDGREALRSAAFSAESPPGPRLVRRDTWGMRLVELGSAPERAFGSPLPPGPMTSARVAEAGEAFARSLAELIEVAPREHTARMLSEEIRALGRRVNALEHRLIPELREDVAAIQAALDQREREDGYRLRRIKRRLEGERRSGGTEARG